MGCIGMYVIVNLMQGDAGAGGGAVTPGAPAPALPALDFSLTFSLLGYCLLPIVLLAALAVFVSLKGVVGTVLGVTAILWSTLSAARFFEAALGMSDRKWLIAYPAGLFYAVFALVRGGARARARGGPCADQTRTNNTPAALFFPPQMAIF